MRISKEDVEKVAALAYLSLAADEVERFRGDLSDILDAIELMSQADTSGVSPSLPHGESGQRPDVVRGQLPTAEALRSAPQHYEDYFAISKVLP